MRQNFWDDRFGVLIVVVVVVVVVPTVTLTVLCVKLTFIIAHTLMSRQGEKVEKKNKKQKKTLDMTLEAA